jgi:hypothetical protein
VTNSGVWTCLRISAIRSPIDGRLTAVVERLGEAWAGWTASVAEATTIAPDTRLHKSVEMAEELPAIGWHMRIHGVSPGWWAGL